MTAARAAADYPPGWRVEHRDTVVSTMDEVEALAAAGAGERTAVVARTQTGGRGRLARQWVSPAGNLYLSVLLRPPVAAARAAELTFVTALAVAETLDTAVAAGRVTLKWPNDVLIDGRKACGIMLQSSLGPASLGPESRIDWIVIGIGVNLTSHPAETSYLATDLVAAGASLAADEALAVLLGRLDHHYQRWLGAGFADIRAGWLARAQGLGEPIAVRLDTDRVDGIFGGLDDSGALEVIRADGTLCVITAGDVLAGRAGGIR